MRLDLTKISFLYPKAAAFDRIEAIAPRKPFDGIICSLLAGVSRVLLKDAQGYPDVSTFAFWCRAAGLAAMKKKYGLEARVGRGILFHVTPSNVPVNFAYSLAAGLLAGNLNIIRVPTREFAQVAIIIKAFEKVFAGAEFAALAPFVNFLRYPPDDEVNAYLSSLCDVRIIWGGDKAIAEIRRAPLNPLSFDIAFADRYSLCAINAGRYLKADHQRIAQGFYNDTYLFDQNACTAPHLVIWTGGDRAIAKAKEIFWAELHKLVSEKYVLQPVQAVAKLAAFYKAAIDLRVMRERSPDNLIVRIKLNKLSKGIENYRGLGGYFAEYSASGLAEIIPILNRKYQTLAYYGFSQDDLQGLFKNHRFYGIDRVVPIGQTTDFSLVWDGYNLINTLSRICSIDYTK